MPATRRALRLALAALVLAPLAACSTPTAPVAAEETAGPRVNANTAAADSAARRNSGGGMPWH